jgi:hypothetical protein
VQQWLPPPKGWIKCNTQTEFFYHGQGASGVALRDATSNFVGGQAKFDWDPLQSTAATAAWGRWARGPTCSGSSTLQSTAEDALPAKLYPHGLDALTREAVRLYLETKECSASSRRLIAKNS